MSTIVNRLWDVLGRPDGPVPLHEPTLGGRAAEYVHSCIADGWVSSVGAFVDRFEAMLARAAGVEHAMAVMNGTAGLHLALRVIGVRPGDEVIVPALTFVATANAVSHTGAVPHLADVSDATLGLDPDRLAEHLDDVAVRHGDGAYHRETGRRLAACVPMHSFGHPVRMDRLLSVCDEWGIPVVEDAAEALGSTYQGDPAGSFGRIGVFSFNGNKIVTTGGGGAVVTNDAKLAARLRHLGTTAKRPHPYRFDHDEVAYNYRLPNLNAALGVAQLEMLPSFIEDKRALAEAYAHAFANIDGVEMFQESDESRSNYWLNVMVLDQDDAAKRDEILRSAHECNLLVRQVWTPMHRLPMYRDVPRMSLPITESLEARIINLPSTPMLARPAQAWLAGRSSAEP